MKRLGECRFDEKKPVQSLSLVLASNGDFNCLYMRGPNEPCIEALSHDKISLNDAFFVKNGSNLCVYYSHVFQPAANSEA